MPHLLYLAIGFPPAAKSSAYRMGATANLFCELGWDVTAVTIDRRAWDREYGLDPSLEGSVDPRVNVVELPLTRVDLDPDIRSYSRFRARHPNRWQRLRYRLDTVFFPEKVFGSWRRTIERGAARVHRTRPVDLLLVSPAPYTTLSGAWYLHRKFGVPYVIDFRDAWSLDVLEGVEAFPRRSRQGRWEQRLIGNAREIWTVNEPIRDFYRSRYPEWETKFRVVRNGFDAEAQTSNDHARAPGQDGLTFGYLGTVNLRPNQTRAILEGWRQARSRSETLRGSRLVFRGHVGAGMARAANANAQLLAQFSRYGVEYGGPAPKAEVPRLYGEWDALVLALAGGRYVTSGKVYEYLATGLPIMSAHSPEHAAADLLREYPLWAPTASMEPAALADAFIKAADLALDASGEARAQARAYAEQFERRAQLAPAAQELTATFLHDVSNRPETGGSGPAPEETGHPKFAKESHR